MEWPPLASEVIFVGGNIPVREHPIQAGASRSRGYKRTAPLPRTATALPFMGRGHERPVHLKHVSPDTLERGNCNASAPSELIALLVATSFAAGLNVYLTVAVLGLLGHTSALTLPASLQPLASWYVIAAAGVLFAVEFFGDKIPAFDLIWNALHTFVRVPVAAFIAYRATAALSPGEQLAATLAGGLIALAAHGGKTAARVFVTPSPEPLSNISLSLGEDALALFLVWFAAHHPYAAGTIALVLVLIVIIAVRWVVRALRALFRGAERAVG